MKAKKLVALGMAVTLLGAISIEVRRSHPRRLTIDEYSELCANRFNHESREQDSSSTEALIRGKISHYPLVNTRSVECRESMCRLEIQASDTEVFIRDAFIVPADVWDGAVFVVHPPDRTVAVLFLALRGRSLPEV